MNRGGFIAGSLALAAGLRPSFAPGAEQPAIRVFLGSGDQKPDADGDGFRLGGKPYRGTWSVVTLDDGSPALINTLPLETYLYSVVALEMPRSWPARALETQAILARTFALGRIRPERAFDVRAGTSDQTYGGVRTETPQASAAVDATRGQVLHFGPLRAIVAYASCCGGHTEDAAQAWGGSFPYLRGVNDENCSASQDYRWTALLSWAGVRAAFPGRLAGRVLESVEFLGVDPSGRAKELRFNAGGDAVNVSAAEFRRRLGGTAVRSLRFFGSEVSPPDAASDDQTIALRGGGSGHGVGLCQWGARGLALAGRSREEILAFFFPGTNVARE